MKTPRVAFALGLAIVLAATLAGTTAAAVTITSFSATEIDTDAVSMTVTFTNPAGTNFVVDTGWRVVDGAWEDGHSFSPGSMASYSYRVDGLEWGTSYQFRAKLS